MEAMLLLKQHMSLSEETLLSYKDDFETIKDFVDKNGISFGNNYALGFYSHMYSFIKRLRENESIESVDGSIRDEIENDIYGMTYKLIKELTNKYEHTVDESEVILASIHIQTAITMKGGA